MTHGTDTRHAGISLPSATRQNILFTSALHRSSLAVASLAERTTGRSFFGSAGRTSIFSVTGFSLKRGEHLDQLLDPQVFSPTFF